jgi:hypothetical protein
VDHSSDGYDGIIMSITTSKHSSNGHDDIIMTVATRKHSSDGPMTSSCLSLLYFSYFNELIKSLKIYLNPFSNG